MAVGPVVTSALAVDVDHHNAKPLFFPFLKWDAEQTVLEFTTIARDFLLACISQQLKVEWGAVFSSTDWVTFSARYSLPKSGWIPPSSFSKYIQ